MVSRIREGIVQNILITFKRFFGVLGSKFRLRRNFRSIFVFCLLVIAAIYILAGVYFGLQIYTKSTNTGVVRLVSNFYPFPAAVVGGRLVWAKDYLQQLNYIENFAAKTKQSLPEAKVLHQQIMDQLIEYRMIEFQSLKYGVSVTPGNVRDAYQKIVDQAGGKTEVKKVLSELYGMSESQFKSLVRQQVLKEKVQNEVIAQIKVLHIYIKDENRAKEVTEKARKGDKFEDLAKQYSEDVKSRDNGGDIGWIARGQLVADNKPLPEFDEAAFKANVNEIVGPIKTAAGFEIAKIMDRKGYVQKSYNDWIIELKNETKIWRLVQ